MHSREEQPKDVLAHTKNNERVVGNSEQCGCLGCSSIFPASTVTHWVGGPTTGDEQQVDRTAVCPHCGEALLVGDDGKRQITPAYMEAMRMDLYV